MNEQADEHSLAVVTQHLTAEYAGRVDEAAIADIVTDSAVVLASRGLATDAAVAQFSNDRIRALLRADQDVDDQKPSVLFLCVHNAGRSQMAAGWMRHLGGDEVGVFGGGSEPVDRVNPAAVEVMAERGIDISGAFPQPWSDDVVQAMDVVVTMGCGDECPYYPGTRYVDWELDDPAGKSADAVRPVRDEIERRVRGLLAELGIEPVFS